MTNEKYAFMLCCVIVLYTECFSTVVTKFQKRCTPRRWEITQKCMIGKAFLGAVVMTQTIRKERNEVRKHGCYSYYC